MIYSNFLYLITAILIFTTAPATTQQSLHFQDVWGIALTLAVFWFYNKFHFTRLRLDYDADSIDTHQVKRILFRTISLNTFIAILLFALEIYLFNLKQIILMLPLASTSQSLLNAAGLGAFFLQLAFIWIHAYRSMNEIVELGPSATKYLWGSFKFNLAILVPYMLAEIIFDVVNILDVAWLNQVRGSLIFQIILLFLVVVIFSPALITYFWDCIPLRDTDLTRQIIDFSKRQHVKFKKILSWNALNKSLVTAGVIGAVPPFRYLMITPGLLNILDKDEILSVVSHEVGHVRKRHLIVYFAFFLSFILLSFAIIDKMLFFLLNTKPGLSLFFALYGERFSTYMGIFQAFIFITLFVLFFRFVFGYFMRNFERQADLFCFESGINPDHLISSFNKLSAQMGGDQSKSNWHHFTIPQRISFLEQCKESPQKIPRHHSRVKRSVFLASLLIGALLLAAYTVQPRINLNKLDRFLQSKIENTANPRGNTIRAALIYGGIATMFYELEEWSQSENAFDRSLELYYHQPDTLNNYAWLLLHCPIKAIQDPKRALKLAKDAVELRPTHYNLDTLAEAYYKNGEFENAVKAAQSALHIANENMSYYQRQLEKMKKAWLRARSTYDI